MFPARIESYYVRTFLDVFRASRIALVGAFDSLRKEPKKAASKHELEGGFTEARRKGLLGSLLAF
jgi:hypothetical protein